MNTGEITEQRSGEPKSVLSCAWLDQKFFSRIRNYSDR